MFASKINNTSVYESKLSREPSYFSTNHYRKLNREYSIKDLVQLAFQVNTKHDSNGCYQCSTVCGYYMTALKQVREKEPVVCNQDLFELVSGMVQLTLSHRETSKYQILPWFDMMTLELWDLAKQLKEESMESDLYIPITGNSLDSQSEEEDEGEEEGYKRAIRISIYHCRALVCEQHKDVEQAIVYYRKCASVRPTECEPTLQQQAKASMQRLISSLGRPISTLKHRSTSFSAYSCDSSSSSSTVSLLSCSHCGLEKLKMPVCAKCRIQTYCSVKCIKSHQSVHQLTCSKS
ncbi:unnamed protein product [Rhizopus stolonifer]